MICKNCGTENPEDAIECKNCGKLFHVNKFKLYYNAIIGGTLAGFILLIITYIIWGKSNTFYFGLTPILICTGAIAAFLANNKNIESGNDLNQILQGIIAGLILGIGVNLILTIYDPSSSGIFILFTLGYAFWAFLGSCIGGAANYLRQKNNLILIPFTITIIIAISLAGYLYTDIQNENHYETEMGNALTDLAFNEIIETEADAYLNKSSKNTTKKISNLKEADIRYKRMIALTQDALFWNSAIIKAHYSPIKTEYSQVMSVYLDLELKYYQEMETSVLLSIKGNIKDKKIHFDNAEILKSKIKKQEILMDKISSKDIEFQNLINRYKQESANFAQLEKQRNELLTFPSDLESN